MARYESYGSTESPGVNVTPLSRGSKTKTLVLVLSAVAVVCCSMVVFQNKLTVLFQDNEFLSRPEDYWNLPNEPWEDKWQRWGRRQVDLEDEYSNPLTLSGDKDEFLPFAKSWANPQDSDFDEKKFSLKTGDWRSLEDYRFYSGEGCMQNPFPDLPPGFLCSSPSIGVYLLDEYGNPYPHRIQRKVRDRMDKDSRSIARVAGIAPVAAAHRARWVHRGRWVNPAGWVASALLPNQTACQDAVNTFYSLISTSGNLTEAAALLSENFVYKGPSAPILPACVADVSGAEPLLGSAAWSEAYELQQEGFNGTESALEGNVSCVVEPTADPLAPLMRCVAKHKCRYTLKTIKTAAGENQVLEGEVLDRFWFNSKGLIEKYESAADPTLFRAAVMAAEGEEGAEAEAEAAA